MIARYGIDKESRCGYAIGLSYPPDWGERTMSLRPGDRTVLEAGMTFHPDPGHLAGRLGPRDHRELSGHPGGAEPFCTYPRKLFVKP